jgi:isorenieratene synthase
VNDTLKLFGRRLPPAPEASDLPDWQQANPRRIERALTRALSLPRSGWTAVDAVRAVGATPRRYRLHGGDYVAWRTAHGIHVAPEACPHMGASLAGSRVCDGEIVCPWHGLRLGPQGHGAWRPLPTFDDGVLVWVGLDPSRFRPEGPILPRRPVRYFDAVMRKEAACEPEDVIANRLDPWHGVHFHPYSFGRLRLLEQTDDFLVVRVVYRVAGPYGVEVDARFDCPDPDTIVMTIVAGEGEGSVVETHATAVEPGRTAILEATLATSDRPRFWSFTRLTARVLRPLVQKAARRLWQDDAAYAERRYALRTGKASTSETFERADR